MNRNLLLYRLLVLAMFILLLGTASNEPKPPRPVQETETPEPLTPMEMITLVNRVRTGRGLPALIIDPILMSTAQGTADIMAAYNMTGHIGDVRGRVMAAGYGAGDIPWATENFMVYSLTPDHASLILQAWSDAEHMKPMADPNYKHIGAGVSIAPDGAVYYVLHAGYTSNRIYKPNLPPGPGTPTVNVISQIVFAVQTAAPGPDGAVEHVVRNGQSLWSIAIAYGTHIEDIQKLNGISLDYLTIFAGQKLRIPTRVVTPTPSPLPGKRQVTAGRTVVAEATRTATVEATALPELPIPETGSSLEQAVGIVLIVLAFIGAAMVAFGLVFKGQ